MAEAIGLAEGILYGMGNPLLDISTNVGDDFLAKYKLEKNNAILAEKEHMPMYKELVENFQVKHQAGGATQNTMRVVRWLSQKPGVTSFIGCVGEDENGKTLQGIVENEGLVVRYMRTSEHPTGICAVLINGTNRSLVANIAAANAYSVEHLRRAENWELVEKAEFYYIAGFFLTVSLESILAVAKHAAEKNKVFSMNLAAPFLSQFFMGPLSQALEYTDYLFGNVEEFNKFAECKGWGKELSLVEIGTKVAALPRTSASKRERCVVITQSKDPVIVIQGGVVSEHFVPSLDQSLIVDSNSAGDAFVGGFLFQLVQGSGVFECVRCGCYAAHTVLKVSGCTLPDKPDF